MAEIYNQGIEDRGSTFETELRSVEEREEWVSKHTGYPGVVSEIDGRVVGFAYAGQYRPRECYRGIGEFSVYIHREFRGKGIGKVLLNALTQEARKLGYWKLVSRIFDLNTASRQLCKACGFREVGTYEKHGQLDGRWIDCVIVARLILENCT